MWTPSSEALPPNSRVSTRAGQVQQLGIRMLELNVYATTHFTPVVHQPTQTTANNHDNLVEGICLFAGISERQRTTTTLWICLHTAEVAGSNPASPTQKMCRFAGKT